MLHETFESSRNVQKIRKFLFSESDIVVFLQIEHIPPFPRCCSASRGQLSKVLFPSDDFRSDQAEEFLIWTST